MKKSSMLNIVEKTQYILCYSWNNTRQVKCPKNCIDYDFSKINSWTILFETTFEFRKPLLKLINMVRFIVLRNYDWNIISAKGPRGIKSNYNILTFLNVTEILRSSRLLLEEKTWRVLQGFQKTDLSNQIQQAILLDHWAEGN